ncbi:DUF1015 domain-containing protein [Catalinimonas niigatensis]|uniref:DUF1015 domain-containing protein n=1 Tax=Catalinimonas niigatensis TaxID=1397264 RepID=UPI00266616A4|nr:DUF1015 domain-containing protein [Catalinimonas niigatensis]WPP52980.1 DUF1015 domain-containing protein [Catalinimonas niigatensis]
MAIIRPLRAWRYNDNLTQNIGEQLSPPFDVVSPNQKKALYRNPFNSIHLSVPSGEHPAEQAAEILKQWKEKEIILQDDVPGMYVYYQYFRLPGEAKEYCRKGFICMIEASFWEEKVVLRHEDTIPGSVNERIQLLEATQFNASPTHGLYTDSEHQLEGLMDQSMENPIYQSEDYQGVRDVLSVIRAEVVIRQFVDLLADKQIILADGHHRYESSLAYRKKSIQSNPHHQGNEGYNFHLMYLSNTESEDLKVLPTHRLITQMPELNVAHLLKLCAQYFVIKSQENSCDIQEVIAGKPWTFGLLLNDECYKLQLRPEVHNQLDWPINTTVKQLDIIILHYFFLEKVLGIKRQEQRSSKHIDYERSFANCLYKVMKQEAQIALITNGVNIEQIKEICYGGHLLPQKSTYFYPKAICGFLFGSINENEF